MTGKHERDATAWYARRRTWWSALLGGCGGLALVVLAGVAASHPDGAVVASKAVAFALICFLAAGMIAMAFNRRAIARLLRRR